MKLIKFHMRSYKSIKDSDYCWPVSDLTTLAGQNESGKSSILKALYDFALGITGTENISSQIKPNPLWIS